MRGDFTRFSHQPGKHYADVLMQQGRVQLDADWNEQRDIDDQRWRGQTIDTVGASGRPIGAPGFTIAPPDGADLTFQPGRIYVDGLFYELTSKLSYSTQPQLPEPEALAPRAGTTDLFYLDVWQRHVTAVEDPKLREIALGGPDTATRVETVAQVKVFKDVGDLRCHDPQKDFDDLVRLSPGMMSARAASASQPAKDPCDVVPGTGFRGVENRLYRVEIHKGGGFGSDPATFVWSRDNGSVLASVTRVIGGPDNRIEVSSLGRDKTLRFSNRDWVEVLSDRDELDGKPGTIAQITNVDEASRTLSLSVPIPAHDPEYLPRVRRWDQQSPPIEVTKAENKWFELEDGIEIQFTAEGFRTGDFWVIPARAAPGTVEGFEDARPRGIAHHYCRLALVTWNSDSADKLSFTVEECVPSFPPLTERGQAGCCTVTVGDDPTSRGDYNDIQEAIDSLTGPGRVCILPGDYQLADTVVIGRAGVVVAGCGGQARITAATGKPALRVAQADGVGLEELWVEANAAPAVQATGCTGLQVRGCRLTSTGDGGEALVISDSDDVQVLDCRLDGQEALSVQARQARLAGNRCASGGIWLRDGSADVLIGDNDIADGPGAGVALGGLAPEQPPSAKGAGVARVAVVGNRIQGMAGSGVATVAPAEDAALADVRDLTLAANQIRACARQQAQPRFDEEAVGGITLRDVSSVRIHDNLIVGNGDGEIPACGIFVHTCRGLRVWDNTLTGNGTRQPGDDPKVYQAGIVALLVVGGQPPGASEAAEGSDVEAAMIHDNTVVSPSGHALLAVALGSISVAGNTLTVQEPALQPLPESRAGHAVYLASVGRSPVLSDAALGFGLAVGSLSRCQPNDDGVLLASAPFVGRPFPEGLVLLEGNQVTLRAPAMGVDPPSAAVAIRSTGDAALLDNQVRTQVGDGMIWAGVTAFAPTLRASANRFIETPCRAVLSYHSVGLANLATGNQANHCLGVLGSQVVEEENQVLLADCERITAALNPRRP
jgi:hypothetical protein